MIENRIERRGIHVLLLLASAVALYPLVSIVMLALNEPGTRVSGFTIPKSISFENFATAWTRGEFGPALISSAIVATTVVVVSVVFSILSGYAFAAMRFPFKNTLFIILLAGLMLPYEALIIPLFFGFRDLGLVDTRWALILPQIGFSVSFGTFWMRAAFEGQLGSIVEAARIDGANSWSTLWRVLVPIVRPATLSLAALLFLFAWNDFLLALVLIPQNASAQTAPLALSFFAGQRRGGDPSVIAAAALIVALPVLIMYVILQRRFVQGMTAGAEKG
jgi:raffinose/stachyose/melibiose transport system permease protein